MESIKCLSREIVEKYCGRKGEGILALLVDVREDKIYPIPKDMEHVDFVALLLSKSRNELSINPQLATHLIPSTINIEHGEIVEVLTGVSGLELGFKVRHNKADLNKAHFIAWNCINLSVQSGIIKIGHLKMNKIIFF